MLRHEGSKIPLPNSGVHRKELQHQFRLTDLTEWQNLPPKPTLRTNP